MSPKSVAPPVAVHFRSITLVEAIEGGKIGFRGPTGEVSLKIPPGTQSGQSFRLRGLGAKGRSGKGNLYARVVVVTPPVDRADEEERGRIQELARELGEYYRGDVRVKVQF